MSLIRSLLHLQTRTPRHFQPWSLSQHSFTAEAPAASSPDAETTHAPPCPPEDVVFRSEKARDLFLRITSQLSADDVENLSDAINRQLGRVIRKNEFYYRGFGGRAVAGKAGGITAAAEEPVAVEKTVFDLKLVGFDAKAKIKVIKEVRAIAGLGLKESKELVEGAPSVIQKDLKKEKAEELKAALEAVGATVELS